MASSSKTITLVSSDGEYYEVPEAAAALSVTIKSIVDDGCADTPIPLPEVHSKTLSKVVEYLKKHGVGDNSAEVKNNFDAELVSDAGYGVLFEYVLAANYLNIEGLLDLTTKKIADLIQNKSPEKVREIFGIVNDQTPEEEAELRKDFAWAFEGVDED